MVNLLVAVAIAVILFVAAYVATQDTEVLVDAPPDGADVDLPAGRVVPEDLRAVRFGMVLRGYRMSEVDQVLDRLAEELAERDVHIADLERVLAEIVEPVVGEVEAQQATAADQPEVEPAIEEGLSPGDALLPPVADVASEPDLDLTPLATAVEAHHPEAAAGPAAVALPGSASDVTSYRLPLVAEPTFAEPTGPVPSGWRASDAASGLADDEVLEPFGAETLVEEPELGAEAGLPDDADEDLFSQDADADRWHVTPIGGAPSEREPPPTASASWAPSATAHLEDDLLFPEVSPAESAAPGAEPARDAEDREG